MNRNDRTRTIYINSIVTLFSQIVQIVLGFLIRKIFINTLGINYLGYNSVFLNILQMLNLADLGVGVAITSFLYKPLAEKNHGRINALMYLYKKIYQILGIVVALIGIVISLFLPFIITDSVCSNSYLLILFYINLIGTVSTYYLSYKRNLLIANQESYITSFVDTCMYFITSIVQIILLCMYPNYIVYLILVVGKNIVSNVILSYKCSKKYLYLKEPVNKNYISEYKKPIINYVKDVFVSKIGAYIFYGTDNIIISIFRGSLSAGYLSNYTLVTTQVNAVVTQVLSSLQATFGNYINTTTELKKQKEMTDNYLCANFILGNFCMICILLLIQPFINLVFGNDFVLGNSTVIWITINLFLSVLIQLPSQIFVIYKLFHYDRPIILISATLNFIVSILLVKQLGIDGVLIGTFITSLVYLFFRFYIICRKVYDIKYSYYMRKIINYFIISFLSTYVINFLVREFPNNYVICFFLKTCYVGILAICIPILFLTKTKEFQYLLDKMVPQKYVHFFCGKKIIIFSILLAIMSLFTGDCLRNKYDGAVYSAGDGNKSLIRTDEYKENEVRISTHEKFMHISFDDTIYLFKDLNENKDVYNTIFDNQTLQWMKVLHQQYGAVFSFYVYFQDENFSLLECTGKFSKEFKDNSDWLKFGFHTIDANTTYNNKTKYTLLDDYSTTINELIRITSEENIDNVVRLQSFRGSKEELEALNTEVMVEPIVGYLTADDLRQSYYLNEEDNKYIYANDEFLDQNNNIWFFSTDLRVEFIESMEDKINEFDTAAWNNQKSDLIIFTHEWLLDEQIRKKIEQLCEYAVKQGYNFDFPEKIILE